MPRSLAAKPGRRVAVLATVVLHLGVVAGWVAAPPAQRGGPGDRVARASAMGLVHASVPALPPPPRRPAAGQPSHPAALPRPVAPRRAGPGAGTPPEREARPAPEAAEPLADDAPAGPAGVPGGAAVPDAGLPGRDAATAPTAQVASTAPAAPAALHVARPEHGQCPSAIYPRLLRDHGAEGTVWLRVHVQADGRAGEVQMVQSSGWRLLDEAALRAVRACRFVPAHRGGVEEASWVEFPVRFALDGPAGGLPVPEPRPLAALPPNGRRRRAPARRCPRGPAPASPARCSASCPCRPHERLP